jgi:hypothetical protein
MKTVAIPFFKCNAQGDELFAVQAGMSSADALDSASSLLDAACGLLEDDDSREAYSALVIIKMAKAAIDAVEVPRGLS